MKNPSILPVFAVLTLTVAHCQSESETTTTGAGSTGTFDAGSSAVADAAITDGGIVGFQDAEMACLGTTERCGDACVDLATDNQHCGSCDRACGSGQSCEARACVPRCASGQLLCDGACTTVETDNANCGACGHPCAGGTVCSHGRCSITCAGDLLRCGDHCADPVHDPSNCGGCGTSCSPAQNAIAVCVESQCATICMNHYGDCNGNKADGCEINLDSNPIHCGRCGKTCGGYAVTSATCAGGTCAITRCDALWGDCDGNPDTGCEIFTGNDIANCGRCGNTCTVPPAAKNVTGPTCSGECRLACATGYGNCDGNLDNGCETALGGDDVQNCGFCGRKCSDGLVCQSGNCVCPPNQTFCFDGNYRCTDTSVDQANCGACGKLCVLPNNASATCQNSTCTPGICDVGWGDCDGDANTGCESHLTSDEKHCGACGTSCNAGEVCEGEHCVAAPACTSVAAPRVLVYHGPSSANMYNELPPASVTTVANDALWWSYSASDFTKYDLIVISNGSACNTGQIDLRSAYATRDLWSPAITGRILVNGLDNGVAYGGDTSSFHRAAFAWLTSGLGTALYVGSDCGTRSLDFLQNFGSFSSKPTGDSLTLIEMPGHPVFAGSTNASLSVIGSRVTLTAPPTFEVLAVSPRGTLPAVVARDVHCAP